MDWLLLKVQSLVVLLTVIRTSDCSTYSVQYSHPYILTYAAGFQYFLTSRSYWKRFLWSHVNKERPGTSLKTVAFCDLLCFHLMILLYISVICSVFSHRQSSASSFAGPECDLWPTSVWRWCIVCGQQRWSWLAGWAWVWHVGWCWAYGWQYSMLCCRPQHQTPACPVSKW